MRTPWVSFDGKDCSGCKHLNDRGYCEFTACIIPCSVRATVPEVKPQTNGDRIRAMTDEELAKKISGLESFALTCGGGWPPERWLDWLKQEVKEDWTALT